MGNVGKSAVLGDVGMGSSVFNCRGGCGVEGSVWKDVNVVYKKGVLGIMGEV